MTLDEAWELNDSVFVCQLPDGLGRVTRLEQVNDRLIAQTESGIAFIVPGWRVGFDFGVEHK
jgi:hypothetical protein